MARRRRTPSGAVRRRPGAARHCDRRGRMEGEFGEADRAGVCSGRRAGTRPRAAGHIRLTRQAGRPYSCGMDWRSRITIEPGKRGGKPCIRGLRITVTDVLEYLASGMSEEEILRDFPDLTREDIRACLAFAADRERKFVSVPPA